ncbi:hypothetical protein ACJZ2D_015569 [Fusarium nematophilum]
MGDPMAFREGQADKNLATVFSAHGRRAMSTRWHSKGPGQACLLTMWHKKEFAEAFKKDAATQNKLLGEIFHHAGRQSEGWPRGCTQPRISKPSPKSSSGARHGPGAGSFT